MNCCRRQILRFPDSCLHLELLQIWTPKGQSLFSFLQTEQLQLWVVNKGNGRVHSLGGKMRISVWGRQGCGTPHQVRSCTSKVAWSSWIYPHTNGIGQIISNVSSEVQSLYRSVMDQRLLVKKALTLCSPSLKWWWYWPDFSEVLLFHTDGSKLFPPFNIRSWSSCRKKDWLKEKDCLDW